MPLLTTLTRILGARRFRGEVAGHIVDIRVGIWGQQTVLVDGARVSEKPWAGFVGSVSHFFTVTTRPTPPSLETSKSA
jgi:hypothetical protein